MKVSANKKYKIIQETLQREDNLLNAVQLCNLAGVSRSGYYHYIATAEKRAEREEKDYRDFLLVSEAYRHRGYQRDVREIYMHLLHRKPPVVMNIKKIRRLMKKYDLSCRPLRRAWQYPSGIAAAAGEQKPRENFSTEISCIRSGRASICYMAAVLDTCTRELLSWAVLDTKGAELVQKTIHFLRERCGEEIQEKVIDRIEKSLLESAGRGPFLDLMMEELNLPSNFTYETFFDRAADWADYYNTERYQWELNKLSPAEYGKYLATGVYPLIMPKPNGGE